MSKQTTTRRKGFSLLSFFLGILFGIIILLGAVGGAVAFFLYADLDTIFNTAGVENTDDEGNYIYVNTDTDNGGVKNTMELITKIMEMSGNWQNLTLGEIENLAPISGSLVDQVYGAVSDYVEIDMDEVRAVKFSEFATWFQETIYDIRVAGVLEKVGGSGMTDNVLVQALIYGAEADYVAQNGRDIPVWYDTYVLAGDGYRRSDDNSYLDSNLQAYLVEESDGYALYYYEYSDGVFVIAQKTEEGYEAVADSDVADRTYAAYNAEIARLTGNYYTDASGNRVDVNPITIRTLMDDPFGTLNGMYLTDLIGGGDPMLEEILGSVTLGALLDGTVDFEEIVNGLEIATLIDISPDEPIMLYLGYGVSDAVALENGEYQGTCEVDGTVVPCFVRAENGKVTEVYYIGENGEEVKIKGTTVSNINDRIDGISVTLFLDVSVDEPIMLYLGYGLYDVTTDENGATTGKLKLADDEEVVCTVEVEGNQVVSVTYVDEDGKTVVVGGTGINEISGRVNGITEVLRVRDVMDIDESNKLLASLADVYIADLGDEINNLAITDVLDVSVDEPIMVYLGYGVYDVTETNGGYTGKYDLDDGTTVACVLEVFEDGLVTAAYYYNNAGEKVDIEGTGINGINDRINGITNVLALSDIIEVAAPTAEDNNAIMVYFVYSVTDIEIKKDGTITGTYHKDGTTYDCEIKVKDGVITEVYYYLSNDNLSDDNRLPVEKTKVGDVNSQISSLTSTLKIKDIVDVSDSKILSALGESTIDGLSDAVEELALSDVLDVTIKTTTSEDGETTIEYDAILAYLIYSVTDIEATDDETTYKGTYHTTDESGKSVEVACVIEVEGGVIVGVYERDGYGKDSENNTPLSATKINDINSQISGLTSTLKISDIVDISEENKVLSAIADSTIDELDSAVNALTLADIMDVTITTTTTGSETTVEYDGILAYLIYSVTDIKATVNNGETTFTGKYHHTTDESDGGVDCNIKVNQTAENSYVIVGVSDESGKALSATSINGINDQISGLTSTLQIKDIMDVSGNKILSALGDSTINGLGSAVETLTLDLFIDVTVGSTSDNILIYIVYGVTDIKAAEAGITDYQYTGTIKETGETVYITADTVEGNNIITGVYSDAGLTTSVGATQVNAVSSRVSGVTNDLTIGQIIEIDENNTIMNAVKDSTISSLATDIENITINELYADEIYGKDATLHAVTQDTFNDEYIYYKEDDDGNFVLVNGNGKVTDYESGLYTYGEATSLWKLMLYGKDENDTTTSENDTKTTEKVYKLSQITDMISNITTNIQNSTINELCDAGIISMDEETRGKKLSYKINGVAVQSDEIGEMTLASLLNIVTSLAE